jgi:hypothetical protein
MMNGRVRGPFDVAVTPTSDPVDAAEGNSLGRMTLAKEFHGPLTAQGRGTMLTAMTATEGSAGYVAVERVTGTLLGRPGSFLLQHSGTMHGSEQKLSITVVPDSGVGELRGIKGSMTIQIVDDAHHYEFNFELPDGAVPPG